MNNRANPQKKPLPPVSSPPSSKTGNQAVDEIIALREEISAFRKDFKDFSKEFSNKVASGVIGAFVLMAILSGFLSLFVSLGR